MNSQGPEKPAVGRGSITYQETYLPKHCSADQLQELLATFKAKEPRKWAECELLNALDHLDIATLETLTVYASNGWFDKFRDRGKMTHEQQLTEWIEALKRRLGADQLYRSETSVQFRSKDKLDKDGQWVQVFGGPYGTRWHESLEGLLDELAGIND